MYISSGKESGWKRRFRECTRGKHPKEDGERKDRAAEHGKRGRVTGKKQNQITELKNMVESKECE